MGSNSAFGQSHGVNDLFGRPIKSSNESSVHPFFGASTSFGSPVDSSVFAEQKSSLFGNNSSYVGGSTFSVENQRNPLPQSNFSFGTAPLSDSSVKKPFSSTGTLFGLSTSLGGNSFDGAPRNYAFGESSTIFGAPNNSGFGIKSTQAVMPSNSAHGSGTSSIFGVPNGPPSAFQGFGVRSTPSFWSASASSRSSLSGPKDTSDIGAPAISNFSNSNTSGFHLSSIPESGNRNIFGIQSSSGYQRASTLGSAVRNRGSGVAPYSSTREFEGASTRYSHEKIQSICGMPIYRDKSHEELRSEDYELRKNGEPHEKLQSICGMPIYRDKSHEELRSEDYELRKKDGHTTWVGQSSGSACFKTYDTPPYFNRSPPVSNHSVTTSYHPFNSNMSTTESQAFMIPNTTISLAPTFTPSVNPFSPPTNQCSSQSHTFMPQPNVTSSVTTHSPNLNSSKLIPLSESLPKSSSQSPPISTTFECPAFTYFPSEPSSTVSPSIQSTSVIASGHWPSVLKVSQPKQTADEVDNLSTNSLSLSQPSQTLNGFTVVTEVGSQNINGQQSVSSSTVGMQSSLVVNPFANQSAKDQSNVETSIQYGISSISVSDKLSPKRTPLMRIRHVSLRHNNLPTQRHNSKSSEPKVPFFSNKEYRPVHAIAPFLPRENPRAWIVNSSFYRKENTSLQEDAAAVIENHETAILAKMPKLPNGEYYTEPPIKELAAKERAEPGFCSRVNDFVVGRKGYGSIKFLGETDVRHLDLESIIQFDKREVIVYTDEKQKPPVGESLNKPAEVTLLNVKCISKKTGKQYVDGPQVQIYEDMLIKKASAHGAEFVSYDPVQGEWKFRVKHF